MPFDSNGVISPGITHAPGAAQIGIVSAGTYKVTFSVSGTEPSQFALFLNGAPVPGAIYGSGAGTQQNNGQVILMVGAGDVLTVKNHTEKVERAIEQSGLTQRNKRVNVTCPSGVHQQKGLTFACTAVFKGGTTPFVVTQLDALGNVHYVAR